VNIVKFLESIGFPPLDFPPEDKKVNLVDISPLAEKRFSDMGCLMVNGQWLDEDDFWLFSGELVTAKVVDMLTRRSA
jgi:hypothetical protein